MVCVISGFPGIVPKESVKKLFSHFGKVVAVNKAYGAGTAMVEMSKDYEELEAVHFLNKSKWMGYKISVEKSFAPYG